jgi:class 3 adenylate cyclase/tetratricopeptide (TPR) repeat protein
MNCGAPLSEEARFCSNCGAPVAGGLETDERRMVTVLFADLVDSTGLAGRLDPERSREVLSAFYDAASEELFALRGQPEKFIGDAVMAVFGLPQVHEDDAVRAIRAGLAIRDRIQRLGELLGLPVPLQVRVGIESGDVATGVGPAGQLLVTGHAVNAAARLQTGADPSEVLVGETARALTRMSIAFGEAREIPAKGFDAPLTAYTVVSLTTRSARRTIPLIGRRTELSLMRDTFGRTVATGRPHLFSIIGEPGIGKSRLVDELVAGLDEDVTALVGRVQAYDWGATFAPVSEMLRDIAGIDEDEPAEKSRTRLQEVVAGCCDPTEAQRIAAGLALALGLETEERDHEEATFIQEVQSGFLAFAEGLCMRGPVVMAFDGIEEAGPPVLDLIERLTARARHGPGPLLLIAAGRPDVLDARPTWGNGAMNHTLLRLEPLGPEESLELARQAGGGKVREQVAARVAARAGGNPFFIVETTGMLLRHEDTLPMQQGAPLPPTVQAVIAARLDQLPSHLRELARKVSVFLYSFDLSELPWVAPEATQDDLRALEDEEILDREERPRLRWRFRHETLRDVAYASLPKRERLRLHLQIAEGLMADERRHWWAADHLERAAMASLDLDPTDRSLPERAADALAAAGDRARRRMESRAAVELYERALAMAGPEEGWGRPEARVLAGMGEARYWLGEYEAARAALQRARRFAEPIQDDQALAVAYQFEGDIVLNTDGDVDRAEELANRALASAERLDDGRTLTRTLLFAGWVPWTREDYKGAEEVWTRALDMARANNDRWAETRALTSLSIAASDQDDPERARRLAEEAMKVANDLGDQFSMAVASVQLGRLIEEAGDLDGSLTCFDRSVGTFQDLGARWELADVLGERGVAYRELGRLDQAEADLKASLRISEELGERSLTRWTSRALAKVAQRRDQEGSEAAETSEAPVDEDPVAALEASPPLP